MSCRWARHLAAGPARTTIPADSQENLAAHLRSCDRCWALAARLEESLALFDSVQNANVSPHFWPVLQARLRAHDANRNSIGARALATWLKYMQVATASICLIAGTIAGVYLGNSYVARMAGRSEMPRIQAPSEGSTRLSDLEAEMWHSSLAELVIDASPVIAKAEPEP